MAGKRFRRQRFRGLSALHSYLASVTFLIAAIIIYPQIRESRGAIIILFWIFAIYTFLKYGYTGWVTMKSVGYSSPRGGIPYAVIHPVREFGKSQGNDAMALLAFYLAEEENVIVSSWIETAANCRNAFIAILRISPVVHPLLDILTLPPSMRLAGIKNLRSPLQVTQMRRHAGMDASDVLVLEKRNASARRILEARYAQTKHWDSRLDTQILMLKVAFGIALFCVSIFIYQVQKYGFW